MSRLAIVVTAVLLVGAPAWSQQDDVVAITGGRIVTLAGEPIDNGTIVITNGRISEVGAGVAVPDRATVIDASGLEVYPGIMDSVSNLGLTEISSTAATVDTTELGAYNPQLQAASAVHPRVSTSRWHARTGSPTRSPLRAARAVSASGVVTVSTAKRRS